jgi:hypothetical protein
LGLRFELGRGEREGGRREGEGRGRRKKKIKRREGRRGGKGMTGKEEKGKPFIE